MVLTKKPLSKAIKTFYGVGDLGFSLMANVELLLFVFFLTNVAKFSLPMVAIIGSITSIVDACLSPFYGAIISGRKPMKWGRNRSWMLIAPPFVVILFMLQFTKIGPSELISAAIICIGFILSHIIWNIAWVGNVSLIPLLANNAEERGLLSGRRATWTALSGVLFSYIGQPLAIYIGTVTGNEALGYTLLAGIMAFLMLIGYFTVFKITEGYEATGEEEAEMVKSNAKTQISVKGMLKNVYQNPPLIALLIGDFFRYIGFFIILAAGAFYFEYVAQDMSLFALFVLIGALASLVGAFFSGRIIQALSARNASIISLFTLGVLLIIGNFFAMNVTLFFVFAAISRIFLGATSATLVALYADVSIYGEWKTGEDATPFVMGLMNISLKAAVISRGTVIPLALAIAGFDATVGASEAVKQAVINVNMLIPGIAALISSVILFATYKLTRDKVNEMQIEINERKELNATS
ncbi:Na+/melibiose symporter and related transporter [Alkalibaculum sp. M08DMB]|uniref:Na+/melibiose symporter and related transporter n=1 Tax=Alkalibaculum sporogenes TaxID=2655001 RepID=A0A6A7KCM9_9FIRM|nr:Na+/melibiose symporter and related transporter [Alkalibaculum sporogenes]